MFSIFKKPELPKKERSRKFYKAAERVAKYLETLPLTPEQTSKLLHLIAEHISQAEADAACQGARIGAERAMSELEKLLNTKGDKHG